MSRKYFKPTSLTWWASFVPLCAGLFIVTEPLHGMSVWVGILSEMTQLPPSVLINAGLMGIGIRGAV